MIPKMTVVFRDKKRNGVKAQKVKANYNLSDDQGQWLTQIEKQIWSSPSYWKSKKRFIDQLKHIEQLEYPNDRKIKFQNSKSKRGGILTKIKHGEKQFFEDPLFEKNEYQIWQVLDLIKLYTKQKWQQFGFHLVYRNKKSQTAYVIMTDLEFKTELKRRIWLTSKWRKFSDSNYWWDYQFKVRVFNGRYNMVWPDFPSNIVQ